MRHNRIKKSIVITAVCVMIALSGCGNNEIGGENTVIENSDSESEVSSETSSDISSEISSEKDTTAAIDEVKTIKEQKKVVTLEKRVAYNMLTETWNTTYTEYTYDEMGNKISEVVKDSKGNIISESKNILEYDERLNITKDITESKDEYYGYLYEYDNRDRLVKKEYYSDVNTLHRKFEYVYDNAGNMIRETSYYYQPKYSSFDVKYTYIFDADGKIIEKKASESPDTKYTYYENGTLKEEISSANYTKYDERGNKIEFIVYDYDGSVKGKSINVYDMNNNLIKYEAWDGNGNRTSLHEWQYNDKMQLVKEVYKDNTSRFDYILTYKYDSNGNQIYRDVEGKSNLLPTSFEYDSEGNIIKETNYYGENREYSQTSEYQYETIEIIKKVEE